MMQAVGGLTAQPACAGPGSVAQQLGHGVRVQPAAEAAEPHLHPASRAELVADDDAQQQQVGRAGQGQRSRAVEQHEGQVRALGDVARQVGRGQREEEAQPRGPGAGRGRAGSQQRAAQQHAEPRGRVHAQRRGERRQRQPARAPVERARQHGLVEEQRQQRDRAVPQLQVQRQQAPLGLVLRPQAHAGTPPTLQEVAEAPVPPYVANRGRRASTVVFTVYGFLLITLLAVATPAPALPRAGPLPINRDRRAAKGKRHCRSNWSISARPRAPRKASGLLS